MSEKQSEAYKDFRGAIRGWAFSNGSGLRSRIKDGKKLLPALSGVELEEATRLVQSMEFLLMNGGTL